MKVSIRLKQDEEVTYNLLRYLSNYTNTFVLDDIDEVDNDNETIDNIDIEGNESDISDESDESYNSNSDTGNTINNLDNSLKKNIKKEVKLLADYGEYNINYSNKTESNININIVYKNGSPPIGLMDSIDIHEILIISTDFFQTKQENLDLLKDFLLFVEEYDNKHINRDIKKIKCYVAVDGNWKYLSSNTKRDINSVFHPKKLDLLNDIKQFNNSESDYSKHGIPYKRNYLFHGPPGTGKTSMMTALASEFEANLYLVNFTCKITDSSFMKLISKMPSGSVMVLEDIDALFTERVINDAGNMGMVSFSAVLNTLDGIARKNKIVTIMTTNFKDRLDEALIRPGRIDMIVEFHLANNNQIKEMFNSYFNDSSRTKEVLEIIYKKNKTIKLSTAALQKYFFENRQDIELVAKNIDKLDDIVNQYHKTIHNLYM